MNIFGWKTAGRGSSRPARRAVPLAQGFGVWSSGEWPRGYDAQVRELYLENPVAQRAVRLVAEGVASVPLVASDEAARALVLATSAGQGLIEAVAAQLLLHGNAYIEILPGADGRPVELYALRPERVSIEADTRGWPFAFAYKVPGTAPVRLPAESVIHIRSHHPLDDHYGLGCMSAASGPVAIHNAASKWNKALLDNAARPSGALVHEASESLSGEQFDRLKTELQAGFQGANNAGRPMLLEGGLRWQALSLSPAEMDFAGLKAAAAREIALAFGVPPMLLGLPGDATYANYREANRALWRQSILPLAAKIFDAVAQGLAPWFRGLTLAADLDQVVALAEDRERLWTQVAAADFLTLNEKRELVGYPAIELPDDDVTEVDEAAEPEAEAAPEEAEGRAVETKFNPWHDPDDGRFTFAGSGVRSGGGSVSMAKPPQKPKVPSGAVRTSTGKVIINKPTVSNQQGGKVIRNQPATSGAASPEPKMVTVVAKPASTALAPDGKPIVNRATATYREPGLNGKGYKPQDGDANRLARIIYAESLSNPEDFEAIGWAVVNRVGERQFRETLDAVINQPRQYQPLEVGGGPKGNSPLWNETADPRKLSGDKRAGWDNALATANRILNGSISDPTGGATYFISSSTYVRGKPDTAPTQFLRSRRKSGRLIDAPYISTSTRATQNHFFMEVVPPAAPAKARRKKR